MLTAPVPLDDRQRRCAFRIAPRGDTGAHGGGRGRTGGAAAVGELPAVALPKGGGAIHGIGEKFTANPVTGTASLSIPVPTSPGRSGFGPALSLQYDTGSGNGPFGFGWSLALPTIARKTDQGLPRYLDYDESDVFILSGAEDLVPVLDADGKRDEDTTSAPRLCHPPLPPAGRGPLRADRALGQGGRRRRPLALALAQQRPDPVREGPRLQDHGSGRPSPHIQLADLRDPRRQGQRGRLRLPARGRGERRRG